MRIFILILLIIGILTKVPATQHYMTDFYQGFENRVKGLFAVDQNSNTQTTHPSTTSSRPSTNYSPPVDTTSSYPTYSNPNQFSTMDYNKNYKGTYQSPSSVTRY